MSLQIDQLRLYAAASGSQISKLVPSKHLILIGEERDPNTRTCSLFAVDLTNRRELWRNVKIDIDWWFTIQHVTLHVAILQAYEESPLPQPSGIYAIEAMTGRMLWMQPKLECVAIQDGFVYAARRALLRAEYLKLDAMSGDILETIEESELPLSTAENDSLLFPSLVDPQQIASGELETVLNPVIEKANIRGTIEEYLHGELLIASVYSRETKDAQSMLENRLRQDLLIFDRTTEQLLSREQLQSSASYPVTGTYFLTNDLLIYVKESTELKAIDLSSV